jgi:hypothetical protein
MKVNAKTGVIILITWLTAGIFQTTKADGHKSSCRSNSKTGTMEVRDTACGSASSEHFAFGTDTIELPNCISFPCTGKVFCEMDSSTKRMHVVSTVKHSPVSEPFYFRKDVYIFVGITPEQENEFDYFKQQVMKGVKDTALRGELWFDLSSTESAMKNDDAATYVISLRHLIEIWGKISPAQYYSARPEESAKGK